MKKQLFFRIFALILVALATFNVFIFANDLPTGDVSEDEVRFAAVGDTGTGGKEQFAIGQQILKLRETSRFDLLLFLGDNIYPSGSPKNFEKKFLKPYQGLILSGIELRACIGNHDAGNQFGVLLQQLIFGMGTKTYYSFSRKTDLIEFFALDSDILLNKNNEVERNNQIRWLEKSLESSKAMWKVVFLHHPIYSSAKEHGLGSKDEPEMLKIRGLIEPILQKHKVNLVLNGHDHVYERTQPQGGIQYFTSGSGGKLRKKNLNKTTPFFAFGNDEVNSFMLFSVKPQRAEFWAIDVHGNILESGEIHRK